MAMGVQPRSRQPWGSGRLYRLYALGPTPWVCWPFSLLERAGRQPSPHGSAWVAGSTLAPHSMWWGQDSVSRGAAADVHMCSCVCAGHSPDPSRQGITGLSVKCFPLIAVLLTCTQENLMPAMLGTLLLPHSLCGSPGSIKPLVPSALHCSGMGAHQKMCQIPAWAEKRISEEPSGEPAQGSHSTNPAAPNSCACWLLSRARQPAARLACRSGGRSQSPACLIKPAAGAAAFLHQLKGGGREKPYQCCKEQAGARPEPPVRPSVVTAAAPASAVFPTRNIWQAGPGPAAPLVWQETPSSGGGFVSTQTPALYRERLGSYH